jgi:hypothetical protein
MGDAAVADPTLGTLYRLREDEVGEGADRGRIALRGTKEFGVPLLEFTLIAPDVETEAWAPCIVQFDQYVKTMPELVRSELALRALFNHDVPVDMGGVYMWLELEDGGVELAAPDRDGHYGRAVRFRATPLRQQYARSSS